VIYSINRADQTFLYAFDLSERFSFSGAPPRLAAQSRRMSNWEKLAQKIVLSGGTKPFRDFMRVDAYLPRGGGTALLEERSLRRDERSEQNHHFGS
jgi:hypothetical protein